MLRRLCRASRFARVAATNRYQRFFLAAELQLVPEIQWTYMSLFQITSLLVVLAACFGILNYLFLKLPNTFGMLIFALIVSLTIIGLDTVFPALNVQDEV